MRITQRALEISIERLNTAQGKNVKPYTRTPEGQFKANIGSYVLDQAYGGNELQRIANEDGSITVISLGGYVTKKELYYQIHAMLNIIGA